jgi:threonine dehydrogenase-like Zn-dependent dehydrogenase
MCAQGLQSQCETTQVHDQGTGAALFGYSKLYGQVPGAQAELLRVPQAAYGLIPVPAGPPDDRFVYLSDVLPTAWQAVEYAAVPEGGSLAVLGVDLVPERLARAQARGVAVIDADSAPDVAAEIREMTDGRGADAVIDAVGMEARGSPVAHALHAAVGATPDAVAEPLMRRAGTDRLQALHTAIDAVRRGGTVSISGVYGGMSDPMPMMVLFDRQGSSCGWARRTSNGGSRRSCRCCSATTIRWASIRSRRTETEDVGADHVGGERIPAGNHEAALHGDASERTRADHRRVSDDDPDVDRKPSRHRRDERVHVLEERVLVLLRCPRMAVVSRGKAHRDVLQRQRHGRSPVHLELRQRDERLVLENAPADDHLTLGPAHIQLRRIRELDPLERGAVVIDELDALLANDGHEPGELEDLVYGHRRLVRLERDHAVLHDVLQVE